MQFLPADPYPRPGDFDENGSPIMIIVDTSGIHHIGVQYCHCPNAQSWDIQLMSLGFFPATFDNPQTAFLFQVLDDFLLDNLECKTTASNYYSKLRRIMNSSFLQLAHNSVPEPVQNGDFLDAKHPSIMETRTSAVIHSQQTGAAQCR